MVQDPRRQLAVAAILNRFIGWEISVVGRITVCEFFKEFDRPLEITGDVANPD